ncbi:MerR family transcriptional regulator [Ornithinibacillus salinisoli]|uniref:MerR family transcriptional regulator n=2 Tax=Ornithinibacillus salinisoli TaxID=1848459 RepID=A0ABW4VTP2_9BACI
MSFQQLSEATSVPETTVQRYVQKFDAYFCYEIRNRGKKFHPESIRLLQIIISLYQTDYDTEEIKEHLSKKVFFNSILT